MSIHPHLLVRVADVPPPDDQGPALGRLIAVQRHAAMTRWVPAEAVLEGGLDELRQWTNGRGPSGRRIGLAFVKDGEVFVGHGAPGEVSATTGLGLSSVTAWVEATVEASRTGRAPVDIEGERFEVRVADGRIELRALDWDGVIESAVAGDLPTFLDGLVQSAVTAANLAAVAAVAGSPLDHADELRQAARAIVDTADALDEDEKE